MSEALGNSPGHMLGSGGGDRNADPPGSRVCVLSDSAALHAPLYDGANASSSFQALLKCHFLCEACPNSPDESSSLLGLLEVPCIPPSEPIKGRLLACLSPHKRSLKAGDLLLLRPALVQCLAQMVSTEFEEGGGRGEGWWGGGQRMARGSHPVV